MKKSLLILTGLMLHFTVKAQIPTVETAASASNPVFTTAPGDTVPAAYALDGQFERIMIVRLKFQTDLLQGITQMVQELHVRNAVILAGIGSVRGYHVHTVANRNFPSQNTYVQDQNSPADLLSMNGYIIDGRVHAHITLANSERAFGGHLESGTHVFTFAIVTLGILNSSTDLKRIDDKTYR
jgi:uncharacterized protein